MFFLVVFCVQKIQAQEDAWAFLPKEPVFQPLVGDPREAISSIGAELNQNRYDGSIGLPFEFVQWLPKDRSRWAWGLEADSFIQLESLGNFVYPERDSDWYLGTYFSEASGDISNRLEYVHVSSHLGDGLFDSIQRFVYTQESFRFTTSYQPSERFRIYLGLGYFPHIAPAEPKFFAHAGVELYTDYFGFIAGTTGRGYFTYDVKALQELGGILDQNFELGLQWKFKKDGSQAVRLALVYYNGNSQYGQFFQQNDDHWSLAAFFDP